MSYGAIFGKTGKSGFYPTLTITPVGAVLTSVTVTSSTGQVYNATQQDSQWFVQVNDFDTYTVTGDYTGGSVSQDVDVVINQNYDVTLTVISNTLNDNSWATIRSVADAGTGANYWAVGDAKQITLDGTVEILTLDNYQTYVYILGFNHNADLEGNNLIHFGLGTTVLSGGTNIALVDSQYSINSTTGGFRMNLGGVNYGGWKDSFMRTNVCQSFLSMLSTDLRAVIAVCKKYSDNTGNGGDIPRYVTATDDNIWLLSEFEVQGSRTFANSSEQNYQKQYDYYKNGNSKIKYKHNMISSACLWWLRSVHATNSSRFCDVHYNNGMAGNDAAGFSLGFAPAFCV